MNSETYSKRTIIKDSFFSTHLQEERSLRIFLPPGYNELESYAAVYCQDGEQFFNFGRIATAATQLILEEGMEPIIIVGADVNAERRTDDYAPYGERFEAYRKFFIEELIPYTERQYPIRMSKDERVAAGDSLGGTVSLHLALSHPDYFNRVIALSGAFFEETQLALRAAAPGQIAGMDIYMVVGLEETEVETSSGTYNFVEANRRTYEQLMAAGAQVEYVEDHGQHLWGFWQRKLPAALMHYFG